MRSRRSGLAFFFVVMAFLVLVYYHRPGKLSPNPPADLPVVGGNPPTATTPATTPGDMQYEPRFAWLPVLVILSLAGVAALAVYLSRRKPRRAQDEAVMESLASVLDDTLDDLRAEADPRRAVIAAYARLERALAAHGIPRRASETPEELLVRTLGRLDVSTASIRRLTDLFERAKFSQHEVDVEMKEEAISAFEVIRDELRAADTRRSEEELGAARPIEGRT